MKNFNIILTVAMLFSVASVSHVIAKAESHSKDPIVGAWWWNQSIAETVDFGVAVFNEDGTWVSHESAALTRFLPGTADLAPLGVFLTIFTGTWTKTDKGIYSLVASSVVVARNFDSRTFPCTTPADAAAPACPTARVRIVGDFVLQPGSKCKKASTAFTGTFLTLDTLEPIFSNTSNRDWFKLS
jgi:hypothetical protein